MAKISIADVHRKITDPSVSPEELSRYFSDDPARSGPFDPAVGFNPETVIIPLTDRERGIADILLGGANRLARLQRAMAFERRIASGYDGPIIVSEGDSWFQYPFVLVDVIDHLSKDYAIRSLDAGGDTLQNMFDESEYLDAIQETNASVFLFSGGGNDVLGGGNLDAHLRDFDPALSAADHILPSYRAVLDHAIALYDSIFRSVEDAPGEILTLCHGYDKVIPNDGPWLGKPMQTRGITHLPTQKAISDVMVDRFNARLKKLADTFPRVECLDLRGVVQDTRWHDELHPTNEGYGAVAARFHAVIEAKAAPRSIAQVAGARRVTRTRAALHRALTEAPGTSEADNQMARALTTPAIASTGRRGLSLHVGLNTIDPGHYGTDGALVACESDADDMESVALEAGFSVLDKLKSQQGTRANVIERIEQAAKELKAGDIFMFTYAGHGSQMPDFNHDESDNDGKDETLCLYDAMLVDDELYHLWSKFKDDVRVLVVSDSCNSGTNVRAAVAGAALVELVGPAPRLLDALAVNRTLRKHKAFYTALQRGTRAMNDGLLVRELSHPLRCSVLLLAGCQDEELSLDGPMNGRFTQELLSVWDVGTFQGSYTRFHQTIRSGMPRSQRPNLFATGQPNPVFLAQRPFSI